MHASTMTLPLVCLVLLLCRVCFGLIEDANVPIYGIELTMHGAHAAASLPDGSSEIVASIEGSAAYQKLMTEWFDLVTGVEVDCANTSGLTKIVEAAFPYPNTAQMDAIEQAVDAFLSGKTFSWTDWVLWKLCWRRPDVSKLFAPDEFPNDHATKILAQTFRNLHDRALRYLNHGRLKNQRRYEEKGRPYAEMALPSWFFTRVPAAHGAFGLRHDSPVADSSHLRALTDRITTALNRAGFEGSAFASLDDAILIQMEGRRGVRFADPKLAPVCVVGHQDRYEASARTHYSFEGPSYKPVMPDPDSFGNYTGTAVLEWTRAGTDDFWSVFYSPVSNSSGHSADTSWHNSKIPGKEEEFGGKILPRFAIELAHWIAEAHLQKPGSQGSEAGRLRIILRTERWWIEVGYRLEKELEDAGVGFELPWPLLTGYVASLYLAERSRELLGEYDRSAVDRQPDDYPHNGVSALMQREL